MVMFRYGSTPDICLSVVDWMDSSVFQYLFVNLTSQALAAYVWTGQMYGLYICSLTLIERGVFKIGESSVPWLLALLVALFACFGK